MAIKGVNFEDSKTKQVVDKLSIYMPIIDIKDYSEGRYSARLCQDGGGIIISEPTIPHFFWEDPDEIQSLVDGTNVCTVTRLAYRVIATRVQETKEIRTHEVEYRFDKDITCNNEFFNLDVNGGPPNTPLKLIAKMVVQKRVLGVDSLGKDIVDYMPFVVWRMAIDGDEVNRTSAKRNSPSAGLSDAFAKIGITIGTNP
jgi:hypothetical protein